MGARYAIREHSLGRHDKYGILRDARHRAMLLTDSELIRSSRNVAPLVSSYASFDLVNTGRRCGNGQCALSLSYWHTFSHRSEVRA